MRNLPSLRTSALLATVFFLTACAATDPGTSRIADLDRMEVQNREVHEFNKKLDKAFIGPGGEALNNLMPEPVGESVDNFVDNLDLPGQIVNGLLQGNIEGATKNTLRFAFNTVFGLAGLFDVAGAGGLYADETDFGQTLHVWGFAEGDYVELPLLGPSTSRDTVGKVVDLFTNPLSAALPSPEKYYGTGLKIVSKVNKRGRFAGTFDSVLHESADSYTQAKLLYLQSRRHELGDTGGDAYVDIYEDPYAE